MNQIEGVELDNINNHHGGGCGGGDRRAEAVKKEIVQEQSSESPSSEQIIKSEKDNLIPAQLSNTAPRTPSPSSMGKRKKKPKEMHDDLCCQFKKTKKKAKPSSLKSKHAASDHAGKSMSCKREFFSNNGLHSTVQVKTPTMIRAEEIQSSLGSESPSFVKLLVRSHVSSCFWMGLPTPFCKLHLPRKDTAVILEDESGEQFQLNFIAERTGLSAGWRKFAAAHKLVEGDVLIFQLIEPHKFKVYLVRANDLTEVDGALGLLNLDTHAKQNDTGQCDAENAENALNHKKSKRQKSLPAAVVNTKRKTGVPKSAPKPIRSVKQLENDSEEVGSGVLVGPRFSRRSVRIRDIKNFEGFNILVDGLCIDSELPEHVRVKYYELCFSKNAFIHARLLLGLNSKLVAGIICETVNIAEAIRACKLTTSRDEFTIWDKTLKSFELIGMNVGFLRARLRHLLSLSFESEDAHDTRRYVEAKTGKIRAEGEMKDIEAKLVELKEASEKFGADIEALKSKAERYEHKFQDEVDVPW